MARRLSGAVWLSAWLTTAAAAWSSGCATGGPVPNRAEVAPAALEVTAVIALPPQLGFGQAADQLRAGRRMADALIEATGGHAILAEELPTLAPASALADGVRVLGELPAQTVTFSVTADRSNRVEPLALGGPHGAGRAVRVYQDYTVRLEVRRVDTAAVVGSVETFASALANAPELDATGRPQGLPVAITTAMTKALRSFAPELGPREPFPSLLEAPQWGEDNRRVGAKAAMIDKLKKLEALYPEASTDDLASLSSSRARFFVVSPGRLAALGIARGDLVSGTGGHPLGSRGAFARTLARGDTPAMSIDRGRGHFLLGQKVAQTPALKPFPNRLVK